MRLGRRRVWKEQRMDDDTFKVKYTEVDGTLGSEAIPLSYHDFVERQ